MRERKLAREANLKGKVVKVKNKARGCVRACVRSDAHPLLVVFCGATACTKSVYVRFILCCRSIDFCCWFHKQNYAMNPQPQQDWQKAEESPTKRYDVGQGEAYREDRGAAPET